MKSTLGTTYGRTLAVNDRLEILRRELRARLGFSENASLSRRSSIAVREGLYGIPRGKKDDRVRSRALLDALVRKFSGHGFAWSELPDGNVALRNQPTISRYPVTLLELWLYPVVEFDDPGTPRARKDRVQKPRTEPARAMYTS